MDGLTVEVLDANNNLVLIDTWDLQQFQRVGTWPSGYGAMGAFTTVCNAGALRKVHATASSMRTIAPTLPDRCAAAG